MLSRTYNYKTTEQIIACPPGTLLSLVIPTYNEGQNIRDVVARVSDLLDETLPNDYELIVVDDDSPDQTWKIAQSLTSEYPRLSVIRRCYERGLSTAVIRGWQTSVGEILGVIDGDLQHPPEILLKLLIAIEDGADLAVASRHMAEGGVSDWSLARRFLSRGAQLLGLILLPGTLSQVSDPMSGCFLVRRRAVVGQTLCPLGYKILVEVLARGDIGQIAEIGYVFQERRSGTTKVTWKQYVGYLRHLLRLRFSMSPPASRKQRFNFPWQRFIQFSLVGLTGVFVDMAILYLLHDPTVLGWGLTRSKILAAETAIINNFLWNDAWTFADLAQQQQGWHHRLKRFLKFNLVCLLGLCLNVLLLNLLFNSLGVHYLAANLVAIATITFWNFWINLRLNWRVTQVQKD
ncbi:MAG: glycosyltransferase [Cyanothece sp. SIO1E1]|nr:glycosyltransferase [Cyanothece sp. SIO1E1]